MADAINTVAGQVPRRRTSRSWTSRTRRSRTSRPTCAASTFATNENSYLIGYMAAQMVEAAGRQAGHQRRRRLRRSRRWTSSSRATRRAPKAANPNIKVLKSTTRRSSSRRRKCKELALNQIAKGSQVVFQVAGGCGLGALSAAAGQGRLGHRRGPRPVGPRRPHPHERREARRHVGVRHDQGRPGRAPSRAARTRPSTWPTRASPSARSAQGAAGHPRRGRGPEAEDHRRGRSRPPTSSDARRRTGREADRRAPSSPGARSAGGGGAGDDAASPSATPGASWPRTTSTSISAGARCTPCSARTAPASPRS